MRRRDLLGASVLAALGGRAATASRWRPTMNDHELTLFLCGDVMLGRGIDQIQPQASRLELFEPYVRSALDYVELAERATGPLPRRVPPAYVWGDALDEWARVRPDARIINLETAVTTADAPWPRKGIHYRMHPANVGILTTARIDCGVLANNHVLDWGRAGLGETLDTLHAAGVRTAGAGRDARAAAQPAILPIGAHARVLVFAFATLDSGALRDWAATDTRAGLALLPKLSASAGAEIAARVRAVKQPGDVVVASIHWGGNWGYAVPAAQRAFAHALIESAQVDVVHGHSSHHFKGLEVHRDRLILYGCGDFINDYEGIGGYESYRAELGLMYFPTVDARDGTLRRLTLTPTCVRHFRVNRATPDDARWMAVTLDRESRAFGTRVERANTGELRLAPEERL
jgi:poly-gamma-glutamate synthesis protein (capsule biosynthesis protein)